MKKSVNKSFANRRALARPLRFPDSLANGRSVGHPSASRATARAWSFLLALALLGLAAFASANAYAVTATKAYVDDRDAATLSAATASIASATNGLASQSSLTSLSSYVTGVSNKMEVAIAKKADASSLAKVATSGSYADLSNKPTIPTVPTAVSAFENDAGYLTDESDPTTWLTNDVAYVRGKKVISAETDPTVPSWAKAETKPSYSASEVANLDPQGVFISPGKMNEMVIVSDGSQTAAIKPGGIAIKASKEKDAGILFWPNVSGDALTLATTSDILSKISATDPAFSSAVLQVGIGTLGITTNDLQVVHDLAGLPVGTSITTVGGLLAALAAGLAALKKSVSTLSAKVDDANAALEEVA